MNDDSLIMADLAYLGVKRVMLWCWDCHTWTASALVSRYIDGGYGARSTGEEAG